MLKTLICFSCFSLLSAIFPVSVQASPAAKAPSARECERLSAGQQVARIVPAEWNGKLLIWVAPETFADERELLHALMERQPFVTLEQEGWMITAVSGKRSGASIATAEAVRAAQDRIVRAYGLPLRTVMMGEAKTGDIVLAMAEQEPARVSGAVVIGSGFIGEKSQARLTFEPASPLLLMANRDHLSDAQLYASEAARRGIDVALWQIERDGDHAITDEEFLASALAVDAWLDESMTAYAGIH